MEEKGRLLYEEEIRQKRVQAELNTNHIGMFICLLLLLMTWTAFGASVWESIGLLWVALGFITSLILTGILLYVIGIFGREEFTQFMPIKVYDKGVLMPITNFDRILFRKQPFIPDNDLESVVLVRARKPDQKDILIATNKQGKTYKKKYIRYSDEPENILDSVRISAPQARISINE